MTDSVLEIRDIRVTRGGQETLRVEHLAIQRGETFGIIGPNGAGKSTLLYVLGLLQTPDRGEIYLSGERVDRGGNLLAYRRRMAVVFQDPLLLNATVYENAATGLRFRGLARIEERKLVELWLDRLGVAHLAGRRARTLSGGEAQRVSLARALVLSPEVLLLDEPFSALDAPTRAALLDDLAHILAETEATTVFVTHDRGEALALSDRLAVMIGGRIRQLDSPARVFAAPCSEEVAAFVGVETIVDGRVEAQQDGLATIKVDGAQVQAVYGGSVGQRVLVLLRPEDVTLAPAAGGRHPSSARNAFRGTVSRVTPLGPLARVVVDCGFPLVAMITHQSHLELGLARGSEVVATFKATAVHVIRRE